MNHLLVSLALVVAQMNTLQEKPIVHLEPHSAAILSIFGGKELELINAPPRISLPKDPPKQDERGDSWLIRVRNFGPNAVTVVDAGHFSVQVNVGQTVQIESNGKRYLQRH
jgi:hypothetical protein